VVAAVSPQPVVLRIAPKQRGRLRISSFLKVAYEIIAAVKETELVSFDLDRKPSDWFIVGAKVDRLGHLSILIEPEFPQAIRAADKYRVGLRMMQAGKATPTFFTHNILDHTDRALKVTTNDGVESFGIETPKGKIDTTPKLAGHVRAMMKPVYDERTTIDGQLIRIEWESPPRFFITHPLTNQRISCIFKPADLEKAKAAFPHRVEATGTMRLNSSGQPVSFVVDHFEKIPLELPTLDDLSGVNITNGLDPSEFVRRLRDGE
jgi:hypothetical protein